MDTDNDAARSRRVVRRAGERGRVTVASLLMILLIVSTVYLGMKFIPVRTAAFQLDDTVREQVIYAGAKRRRVGDAEVRRQILEHAAELGLPISRREIAIRRAASTIQIRVVYTVPVELPLGITYDWKFESDHEGPSF